MNGRRRGRRRYIFPLRRNGQIQHDQTPGPATRRNLSALRVTSGWSLTKAVAAIHISLVPLKGPLPRSSRTG